MESWEEPQRLPPPKRRRCVDPEAEGESGGGGREGPAAERLPRLRGSSASDRLAAALSMQAEATERLGVAMRERDEIRQDQLASQWFSLPESLFTTPQAKEYMKLRREFEVLRLRKMIRQIGGPAPAAPAKEFSSLSSTEGRNEYWRLRKILDNARILKLRARIAAAKAAAPASEFLEER